MALNFIVGHAIRDPAEEKEENIKDTWEDKDAAGKRKTKDEHNEYGGPDNECKSKLNHVDRRFCTFCDIGYDCADDGIVFFSQVVDCDNSGGNNGDRNEPRYNLILRY